LTDAALGAGTRSVTLLRSSETHDVISVIAASTALAAVAITILVIVDPLQPRKEILSILVVFGLLDANAIYSVRKQSTG
jgi:hypothetical protein